MSAGITLLVANPTARTGKAARAIDRALEGLGAAGLHPEFFATLPEGKTVAATVKDVAGGLATLALEVTCDGQKVLGVPKAVVRV